jgi:Flp pilus assembly protein TadG
MTSMDTRPQSQRNVSGQSAVEVALLLPGLIILVLGMIAVGFTFYAFIQVTNAAREGARAGALVRIMQNDPNYSDLDTAAQKAICNSSAGTSALGFLTPPSNCNSSSFNVTADVTTTWTLQANSSTFTAGDRFRVDIAYRYTMPAFSRMLPMFPRPIVIKRTVFMEVQL